MIVQLRQSGQLFGPLLDILQNQQELILSHISTMVRIQFFQEAVNYTFVLDIKSSLPSCWDQPPIALAQM
jgi:hypothetical protein